MIRIPIPQGGTSALAGSILILFLVHAVLATPRRAAAATTDTPLPTPTVTSTPTALPTPTSVAPPSAVYLLAQVDRAFTRENTVHFTEYSSTTIPKADRLTETSTGDEIDYPASTREVMTMHDTKLNKKPPVTKTAHLTMVEVDPTLASRTGAKPWKCAKVGNLLSGSGPASPLPASGVTTASTDLGGDSVNGVRVWHIRTSITIAGFTRAQHPEIVDDYISQADGALLREVTRLDVAASFKLKGKVTKLRSTAISTMDFSRYGEQISIALPPVCVGS